MSTIMTRAGEDCLRLRFSTLDSRSGRSQVDQWVALAATRPSFGDERWWFVDDGRRVARLHLAPGGGQFRSGSAQAGTADRCALSA